MSGRLSSVLKSGSLVAMIRRDQRERRSGSRVDLSPKLPCHRACGAVHDGSHKDCKAMMFLSKVRESKLTKGLLCKHKVHVAHSSIPPRTAPVPRRLRRAVQIDSELTEFIDSGSGCLPLTPDNSAKISTNPLIRSNRIRFYIGDHEIGHPSMQDNSRDIHDF